jgi:hypothetical protein
MVHLLHKWFMEEYPCWYAHGELFVPHETMVERMVCSTSSASNVYGVETNNWVFCRDACVELRPPKEGATVRQQQHSIFFGMFVQPFSFISYYFLELNLVLLVFISRRHRTTSWRRDTGTILRPTWTLIRFVDGGRIVWWTR